MSEVWKPISEYHGYYEISTLGNIRRISRYDRPNSKHLLKEKMLTPRINVNGYYTVTLWLDGKKKTVPIHRLVAITFLDNPNHYKVVHHKNSNKLDNRVENLEWCTHQYNCVQGDCQDKRQLTASINYLKSKGYTIINPKGETV